MAALAVVEPETGSADPFTGWLDDVLAQLGATVADAGEVSDAATPAKCPAGGST